jgi:hypothetical protein
MAKKSDFAEAGSFAIGSVGLRMPPFKNESRMEVNRRESSFSPMAKIQSKRRSFETIWVYTQIVSKVGR